MIRIQNEEQLLTAFREKDRKEVRLPAELSFPFGLADYFAWEEQGGGRVSLLSVSAGRNRTIGIHLCRDLGCKEKVQSAPKATDVQERVDSGEKLRKVLTRMGEFIRSNLF